ncbi:MAG: hypothetical protein MJK04_36065 [Psychrosphaera sp.]|nr:hypothetical protein [Psychrosphaera sp.]
MTNYKHYLATLTGLVSLSLIAVGTLSYHVDPANLYHEPPVQAGSPSAFAAKLTQSKFGLTKSKTNKLKYREIKQALARQLDNVECAVIGSSHVWQISALRPNRSLSNLCESISNLGVPGATLEDYLALSYEVLNTRNRPKTLVIGVDPWSLSFNKDARWQAYEDSHDAMIRQLKNSGIKNAMDKISAKWQLYTNLLNLEYFLLSIENIGVGSIPTLDSTEKFQKAPASFVIDKGLKDIVLLPDGGLVYGSKFLAKTINPQIKKGGAVYKLTEEKAISEDALQLFSYLVTNIAKNNITVVILMTPYHQNVWADKEAITTKALVEVETRLKILGKQQNIRILGSYNPHTIGCKPNEFFDYMHPKDSCVAKIKN